MFINQNHWHKKNAVQSNKRTSSWGRFLCFLHFVFALLLVDCGGRGTESGSGSVIADPLTSFQILNPSVQNSAHAESQNFILQATLSPFSQATHASDEFQILGVNFAPDFTGDTP